MANSLHGKHIILGVTGSIAAYKSAELIRALTSLGALVQVVMTEGAKAFITPLTLQALSGRAVRDHVFDSDAELAMGHIELARWADLIIIAPASANVIASLSQGQAGSLISTLCLATSAPVVICPAMNEKMWAHPATKKNVRRLKSFGYDIFGPAKGEQACGDMGWGRMQEPEMIVEHARTYFSDGDLTGLTVLITAGPTREAIDPVRFISNHSSGKMGYAMAIAARARGARVILISGPTALERPDNVDFIQVESANEMYEAVMAHCPDANIFISVAAVSDFYCLDKSDKKRAKSNHPLTLSLGKNIDIVAQVQKKHAHLYVVGFAAQTHDVEAYAKKKRIEKSLPMMVANRVGEAGVGFNSENNQVSIVTDKGIQSLAKTSKKELAILIWDEIRLQYQQWKKSNKALEELTTCEKEFS